MFHRVFCLLSSFLILGQIQIINTNAVGANNADSLKTVAATSVSVKKSLDVKDICFMPGIAKCDASVSDILLQKTRGIIGRTGCGAEDASYLIVPSLVVEDVRHTSGTTRNMSVAKGKLILEAVSADNPEVVWHSASVTLKVVLSGNDTNPEEALAKKINIEDKAFTRFVRIAREKISERANLKDSKQ